MIVSVKKNPALTRSIAIDALLIGAALLIPTLSHLTALPLYRLSPMTLVLLTGMTLVKNRNNSLILAVVLPLISSVTTGMPTLGKALCMTAELSALTLIFDRLPRRRPSAIATWSRMMAAMLGAKAVYYLLKALMTSGPLFDTAWSTQLLTAAGYSILFAGFTAWRRHSQDRKCGHDRC